MYTIYLLRSSDGLGYVGRTQNYKQRIGIHKSGKATTLIAEAIRDLGWEGFSVEVLEQNLDRVQAKSREEFWILELKTLYPDGYNLRIGDRHTEEQRKQFSEFLKGNNFMKGRHHSSESKEKMRENRKGIPCSEETKKKLRRFITVPGFTLDDI